MKHETVDAVTSVDLTASTAEFICVYGASGSGKTTLLNLLAGLDSPDSGSVCLDSIEYSSMSIADRADFRRQNIGVVFQNHNLINEFSAAENVALPLEVDGLSTNDAIVEAKRCLGLVDIEHLAERRPLLMSGGQRQRVGIARALVGSRRLLLADEPTGSLDSANSKELFDLIRSLCSDGHLTCVLFTHDPLGRDFATRVLEMRDGHLIDETNRC